MSLSIPHLLQDPNISQVTKGRIIEVQNIQKSWGMEPRNDSKLTVSYALGTCEDEYPTPHDVAHELMFTDRIYKFTLYGQIIEDVMREVAGFIKRKYKIPWTGTWKIVRFYVPPMLKFYLMRKTGRYFHLSYNVYNSQALV